jgi:hypothetical protein
MKRLTLAQTNWFYTLQEKLRNRSVLLELFSITDLPVCITKTNVPLKTDMEFNAGDYEFRQASDPLVICAYNNQIAGVTHLPNDRIKLTYLDEYTQKEPALSLYDELELISEYVPNYKGPPGVYTTVGRYVANYFIHIHPFGDKIPYVNGVLNLGDTEQAVATLYIDKTIDLTKYGEREVTPHDNFMNNLSFLCGFGDLFIPTLSKKSLTTSPEVLKRKQELLEKYKDQLHDPVIASKIEDELIALDKEWLKDDPSYGFYASESKKFNIHRKKQFITGGVTESFGEDPPTYKFIESSLSDGWKQQDLPVIFNDIRRGSHSRGKETELGGTQTKYLLRVFQNTKIEEEDCGTTRGLTFRLTKDLAPRFIGRYLISGNNKLITLDEDTIKNHIDKTITIRSFMYCNSKPGVCYKCAGQVFEQLDTKALGVFSVDIGTTFLLSSMKAMHGTKSSSFKIENISDFLVDVV